MQNDAQPGTYKRPPVPSAEESARASWIAPLVAVGVNMFVGKASPDPTVKIVVGLIAGLIILVGIVAALWAIYVASFYGPRKHIFPAVIGMALNACIVLIVVTAFQTVSRLKAEHEAQVRETPAVAQQPDNVPDRY